MANDLEAQPSGLISRRRLLKISTLAGGGLLLSCRFGSDVGEGESMQSSQIGSADSNWQLHMFVSIEQSNMVTISTAKHEMGQGIETGIARIIAEELGADWKNVRVARMNVDATTHALKLGEDDFGTGGSYTTRSLWQPLREAGALVRDLLRQAAAQHWQTDVSDCIAESGFIVNRTTDEKLPFGQLADSASRVTHTPAPSVKSVSDFKLIGKSCSKVDVAGEPNGQRRYSIDVSLPGVLHASLLRPPVTGGVLQSIDSSAALKVPGVKRVIELEASPSFGMWNPGTKGGVAVLADSTWAALQGRKALLVEWNNGANASRRSRTVPDEFKIPQNLSSRTVSEAGPFAANQSAPGRKFSANYRSPYLAHGLMEPLNATARISRRDEVEIWTGTQNPYGAALHVARQLDIDPYKVTVYPSPSGGGFGRRYFTDYIIEAVLLAKAAGSPVKLLWTREDEIQHGRYHPFRLDHHEVVLDRDDNILAWQFDGYTTHDWGASTHIPASARSHRVRSHVLRDKPVDAGSWRAVMKHLNVFSYECFIDELAHLLGKDPLDYRLSLLRWPQAQTIESESHRRTEAQYKGLTRVLQAVAEMADWGRPRPKGTGLGIAVGDYNDCYCAEVAQVKVQGRHLVVSRVYSAIDCGIVINPSQVKAQVEGGILWALSPVLHGGIELEQGAVVQSNFHDLNMLRIHESPDIEVRILESDRAPVGVGEASVPPLAPATLNAIFAACGKRIRNLHAAAEIT